MKKKNQSGKVKRKKGLDEEIAIFALKIVVSTSLFFILAIGMDLYKIFH